MSIPAVSGHQLANQTSYFRNQLPIKTQEAVIDYIDRCDLSQLEKVLKSYSSIDFNQRFSPPSWWLKQKSDPYPLLFAIKSHFLKSLNLDNESAQIRVEAETSSDESLKIIQLLIDKGASLQDRTHPSQYTPAMHLISFIVQGTLFGSFAVEEKSHAKLINLISYLSKSGGKLSKQDQEQLIKDRAIFYPCINWNNGFLESLFSEDIKPLIDEGVDNLFKPKFFELKVSALKLEEQKKIIDAEYVSDDEKMGGGH